MPTIRPHYKNRTILQPQIEGNLTMTKLGGATGRKRKRKSEIRESRLSPATSGNFKAQRLEEDSTSTATSGNSETCENFGSESDRLLTASCCSSNEWSDDLAKGSEKFVDLEESEPEAALEFFPNRRDRPLLQKTPLEAQLEEFFAAAERKLQEQFLHKYNYDIVKDKPVEGQYEWVQIHQN